jgi:hypothetical protein
MCWLYSLVGLHKDGRAIRGTSREEDGPADVALNVVGDATVAVAGELALGGA